MKSAYETAFEKGTFIGNHDPQGDYSHLNGSVMQYSQTETLPPLENHSGPGDRKEWLTQDTVPMMTDSNGQYYKAHTIPGIPIHPAIKLEQPPQTVPDMDRLWRFLHDLQDGQVNMTHYIQSFKKHMDDRLDEIYKAAKDEGNDSDKDFVAKDSEVDEPLELHTQKSAPNSEDELELSQAN